MGLDESNGDKHQNEKHKPDQKDSKMKQKDQLFSTFSQIGVSVSKALLKGKEVN